MKKVFFTLLVITAGIVCTASAANVTRRIVVENQMASWNNWNNDVLYIYIYTTEGETKLNGDWGTSQMTKQGSYTYDNATRRVFYYDLTADESVFENSISIIVFNDYGKDHEDSYNRIKWEGQYSNDLIIYVYPNGYPSWSTQPLSYFLVNSNGACLSTLSYTQGTQLATGTYNNTAETFAIVAPNYALWDGFSGIRDWSLVYRAANGNNDYDINSFQIYNPTIDAADKVIKFSWIGNYQLSFNMFNKTSTITPYIEKTIGDHAYSSFSSDYDFATPEGVTAYYASDASSKRVTLSPITNGVPAGQGVILNGTAGETVKLTPAATTDALTGNKLVAVKNGVEIPASTGTQFNYVFAYQNNDLGFFKLTNSVDATADMAYLQTSEDISNAKVVFGFDEEATGIESIENTKADNAIYNLNGVRVDNPTKGIFIQNGKKVIIK